MGTAPCGAKAFEGHRCRFRGGDRPVLVIGAEYDRIVSTGIVRRTAARYQTGSPLRFPVPTTWSFQARRYRSLWATSTSGWRESTSSPRTQLTEPRRHGIASANAICPSKPNVFAMSR